MPSTRTNGASTRRSPRDRMATVDDVRERVEAVFDEGEFRAANAGPGRVVGEIIAADFEGKTVEEQLALIKGRIRDFFGTRGLNIGFLYPLTPAEARRAAPDA